MNVVQIECIFIFIFQMFILIGTMNAVKPHVTRESMAPGELVLTCYFDIAPFIISIVYNSCLLFSSVYCAIKTRKLPDNFNESKFISFCVQSTVVIQLSFIPAYFVVGNPLIESMFMCLSIILTGYLILLCIFAPKIYALYFVEEKRQHVAVKRFQRARHCSCPDRQNELEVIAPDQVSVQSSVEAISLTVAPPVNLNPQGASCQAVCRASRPQMQQYSQPPDLIVNSTLLLDAAAHAQLSQQNRENQLTDELEHLPNSPMSTGHLGQNSPRNRRRASRTSTWTSTDYLVNQGEEHTEA